jgi:hypothetical protein
VKKKRNENEFEKGKRNYQGREMAKEKERWLQ